jgi:hypothetical protein
MSVQISGRTVSVSNLTIIDREGKVTIHGQDETNVSNVVVDEQVSSASEPVSPNPCTPVPLPQRVFRIVPIEDAARGRWDAGRLAVGESEEEIRTREGVAGGVFVELMTEHHRHRLHLDGLIQRRWMREEDAREERMMKRRREFVAALTGERDQISTVGGG